MSGGAAEGLHAAPPAAGLFRDPALRRLWERVRHRLEADGGRSLEGAVTLAEPTAEERRAAGLLLGTSTSGRRLAVPLARLDEALRSSAPGAGLIEWLERTGPPLRDRSAEKAAAAGREAALWAAAASHAAVARHPGLSEWLAGLRATGRLRRADGDEPGALLSRALDVLAELPSAGTGRAVLAGSLLGDAHALDDDRPVASLVVAALACLGGAQTPSRASDRRALWDAWGVATDAVSSRVLACGLRLGGGGPLARALDGFADAGVPVPVTLGMLDAAPWTAVGGATVRVCENPAVVEAASRRLGAECPPLVCVEGMPSVAARRLLLGLRRDGVELRYHGDFGAGGVRIGNVVIGELGALPWRFGASDYLAALDGVRDASPIGAAVPDAVWDPDLAPLLRAHRREVHEEQVLGALLGDLGGG